MCVLRGASPILPGLPVEPVWPHWCPRVGSLPIIAGPRCRPGVPPCIAPRPVRYALRPEPGLLPQDHPGSGVVAPWLPPGQLHGIRSTSPSSPCCPVCCVCIGAFTASRHARSRDRSHDLSVARPTLSPVELAGDPMCALRGGWKTTLWRDTSTGQQGQHSYGIIGLSKSSSEAARGTRSLDRAPHLLCIDKRKSLGGV